MKIMLKIFVLGALFFLFLCTVDLWGAVKNSPPKSYQNLQEAQQMCGKGTVVWANKKSRIYHLSADRWYGKTKAGAYVCEDDAKLHGYRLTKAYKEVDYV
jgi:hypothetical protein